MADMVAVLPTFFLFGPISLLAALFPVVFGGLALWVRRWSVFFSVVSLVSLFYLGNAYSWLFIFYFQEQTIGRSRGLTFLLVGICFAGLVCSLLRQQTLDSRLKPTRLDHFLLGLLAVGGIAILCYAAARDILAQPPWKELAALSCAFIAGVMALLIDWKLRFARSHAEPAMLLGLAFGFGLATGTTPIANVKVLWVFDSGNPGVFTSSPLVHDQRLYQAGGYSKGQQGFGILHCLDSLTGRPLWDFTADGTMKQVFSSPRLDGDNLFLGEGFHRDADCRLFCIHRTSGQLVWSVSTRSHTESSPCVDKGRVYCGAGDDGVLCVDEKSGKEIWHFRGLHVDASPAVVQGRVFAGSGYGSHEVFALDAESGKRLWQQQVNLPAFASPLVVEGRVYFGLGTGNLIDSGPRPAGAMLCCAADTGTILWRKDFADAVHARPIAHGDTVCFGCRDGRFYSLDRASGQERWHCDLGSPIVAAAAISPTAANDPALYVCATGGKVCRFNAATGQIDWTFDVGKHSSMKPQLVSTPCIFQGNDDHGPFRRIYFGASLSTIVTTNAVCYCLEER